MEFTGELQLLRDAMREDNLSPEKNTDAQLIGELHLHLTSRNLCDKNGEDLSRAFQRCLTELDSHLMFVREELVDVTNLVSYTLTAWA